MLRYLTKLLKWGCIAQWLAYLLRDPAAPDSFLSIHKILLRKKFVNVVRVNQSRYLKESEQWLENVHRAHLVQASSKLVLQEQYFILFYDANKAQQLSNEKRL